MKHRGTEDAEEIREQTKPLISADEKDRETQNFEQKWSRAAEESEQEK